MVPRVYAPALTASAPSLVLPDEEADHLRRVMRVKPGDPVRVFDGRGLEREGVTSSVGKHAVTVELGRTVVSARECRTRIVLAQAVLKGEKTDDLVRDAVMLGVAAIQPLLTARTEVPAGAFTRGGRVERWQRIAVASAKQCGRAVVPEVRPPLSLAACLAADRSARRLLLAEPAAAVDGRTPSTGWAAAPESALLLIGPEGGWAPEEVDAAGRAGAVPLTLGARTLRADATALVALSVLLYAWGELS